VIIYTLVVVGCMRRGPRLNFEPMKLGTGFGVNSEEKKADDRTIKVDGEDVEEDGGLRDEKGNVVDYQNSSLLSFILLFYVSEISPSTQAESPR
jgi:hypothetical protein